MSHPGTLETVNLAAEASLLRAVLVNPDCYPDISDKLTSEDFVSTLHRHVWSAIAAVDAAGRPLDTVSIADELRKTGHLDKVGGLNAINSLRSSDDDHATIADNVAILAYHGLRRRLWAATEDIREHVSAGIGDTTGLAAHAERRIELATTTGGYDNWADMATLTGQTRVELSGTAGDLPEVSTGLVGLDALTGGLSPGQLILIGARPGMGKSVFAMQLATSIARSTGKTVAFLSYEMSHRELMLRLLATTSGVELGRLKARTLNNRESPAVEEALDTLIHLPLVIDDNPPRTIAGVRASVRRLARVRPLAAVVIDYLQLMRSDQRHEGRTQELSEISREAKLLAGELHVPIIACSQLSRNLVGRNDKRPQLSDLRESGSLEQDANIVLFLHREHVFDNNAPADVAELLVAKNRNGPAPARIDMRWHGPTVSLTEIVDEGFGGAPF